MALATPSTCIFSEKRRTNYNFDGIVQSTPRMFQVCNACAAVDGSRNSVCVVFAGDADEKRRLIGFGRDIEREAYGMRVVYEIFY